MKPTVVFHEAAEGEGSREHRGRQKKPVSPKCNTRVRGLRLICGGDAREWRCFKPVVLSVVPKSSSAQHFGICYKCTFPGLSPDPVVLSGEASVCVFTSSPGDSDAGSRLRTPASSLNPSHLR